MKTFRQWLGRLHRAAYGYWINQWEKPPRCVVEPLVIGATAEGRPLHAYRLGDGKPEWLIVGGLHGNEIGSIKLAQYCVAIWGKQPPPASVWIIPCLNPDGYARAKKSPDYWNGGRQGRFNGNGIDLNRNFPSKSFQSHSEWTHGAKYQERTPVNAGPHGASELETRAFLEFIGKEKVKGLVILHTAGADVTGSQDERGQELSKLYAQRAGYRWFSQKEWEALGHTGTPKEWCEENGIVFLEVEGSTRWGSDVKKQRPAMEALLKKAL